MIYVGKIDAVIYNSAVDGKIVLEEVILTENRKQHIIERRGEEFFDEYFPLFKDIIENPDYVFKDKKENTAIASKRITIKNETVNLVVRLVVEQDNDGYKNSIITAIKESDKRFNQRLRNNQPIYKKLDKQE